MTTLTQAALHAAAPGAHADIWLPALQAAFDRWQFNTPQRQAAALGQFAVEAGPDFSELGEDLYYTHAERIAEVWPTKFSCPEAAASYTKSPQRLANYVYAGKLGNGDTASGDGYRFCGGGICQLTGRDEYTEFADMLGISVDAAADLVRTPEGAAMSGCWYLASNGCLPLADAWMLTAITRRVNGAAMFGLKERIAASNAALRAFQRGISA